MDILVIPERRVDALERLMRLEPQSVGVEDQRVTGDTGRPVVFLTEAAVDDQQSAVRADRQFSLACPDRRVTVDNVRISGKQPEFREDFFTDFFLIVQFIIRILFLCPSGLVLNKGAFKSFQISAAQGREPAAPEIPEEIQIVLFRLFAEKGVSRAAVRHVKIFFAADGFSEQRDLRKAAVRIHRHTAMIEQIAVAAAVHAALFKEERHMPPQPFAAAEGGFQLRDDLGFLVGQLIGILADSGEVAVFQFVDHAFAFYLAVVYLVEQETVFHAVFRMAQDRLTFQLELNHLDRP